MNSFELNTETRLLTDNDLILIYYDEYGTMHFKCLLIVDIIIVECSVFILNIYLSINKCV